MEEGVRARAMGGGGGHAARSRWSRATWWVLLGREGRQERVEGFSGVRFPLPAASGAL